MPIQRTGPWVCWKCGRSVTGWRDGVICNDAVADLTLAACNEHAQEFQLTVVPKIVAGNRAAVLRKRRDKEARQNK